VAGERGGRRRSPARLSRLVVSMVIVVAVGVPLALFVEQTVPPVGSRPASPEIELARSVLERVDSVSDFGGAIPAINYHDVSDRGGPYTLSPRRFAEHMAALRAGGFEPVGLSEVEDLVAGRDPVLPARPILITFDDGPASNWIHVDPVLRDHGMRATAFVITSTVVERGPSYYLSWDQLAQLRDSGRWSIATHTHHGHRRVDSGAGASGPWLTNRERSGERDETLEAWRRRVVEDLDTAQEQLQRRLGIMPRAMAYPFPTHHPVNDHRIPDELNRLVAGRFALAFTAGRQRQAITATSPRWHLPRLNVTADMTAGDLLDVIEEMVPDPFPERITEMRWSSSAGGCDLRSHAIEMTVDGYALCRAEANTSTWADYRLGVRVRGANRDATALIGVRSSQVGRIEVALGERDAVIRQLVHGRWSEIGRLRDLQPADERPIEVVVEADRLTVSAPARPAVIATVHSELRSGGLVFGVASRRRTTVAIAQDHLVEIR
jgi:peptidoglycan/xylan/chitin deacetylase (PgdA/CDA1 family)